MRLLRPLVQALHYSLVANAGLLLAPGILFALMAKETAGPRAAAALQSGRGP